MTPFQRSAVRIAVLTGGAILMALEVAGFRIIGRTFGSALRETTTVIAVFLTAMSLGYWAGGRAGDRRPRLSTLVAALVFASVALLCVPAIDRGIADRVASSGAPLAMHAAIVATALFAIPTFLLASISPIAVRLFMKTTGESGSVAGSISALSTVGSVGGSVVTAFFLLDWLGSINRMVMTLAFASVALAAFLAASALPRLRLAAVAAAAVVLGALTFAFFRAGPVPEIPATAGGTKVLFERDTQYHHILVLDRPGHVRDLLFDRTPQSRYIAGDPHFAGLEYEEFAHIATLIQPVRRVLLIGLGGGTHARQFRLRYPDITVDAVDVDPEILDVAQRFFGVRPDARLRLHARDGRAFLKSSFEKYDLISIDAYTRTRYGSTIPPHLVTKEFFEEAAAHLTDGGVVHYHLFQDRDAPFSRAMYKTLASVFPAVRVFGATELIARNAPTHWSARDLIERAAPLRRHNPRIDQHIASLGTALPRLDDVPVMTDDYAPVGTLLRRSPGVAIGPSGN